MILITKTCLTFIALKVTKNYIDITKCFAAPAVNYLNLLFGFNGATKAKQDVILFALCVFLIK